MDLRFASVPFARSHPLALALCLAMSPPAVAAPTSTQNASMPSEQAVAIQSAAPKPGWREENAYTLGVQAYAIGFPWIHLSKVRWRVANVEPTGGAVGVMAYAPFKNTFWQASRLADHFARTGVMPNGDTLYGVAWLDVGAEPVIVSVPKHVPSRYYTMELVSMDGDNFGYIGTRATGQAGGDFAIVGPNWNGRLPAGVKRLPASRTPTVFVASRVLVDGADDIPAVRQWHQKIRLTPLSWWGKSQPAQPEPLNAFKPGDPKVDPLADFRTLNRAWAENPPPAKLAPLLAMFKSIGIGPGLDLDKIDADTRTGLERAAADGMRMVLGSARAARKTPLLNGWEYMPHTVGRLGVNDLYLERAGMTLSGLVWHDEAEAIYIPARSDDRGRALDGREGRYVVRFAPGQTVPAKAFWSLSLYAMDFNFIDNPIKRYTIGDRTQGLKRDVDGGLTIYIQTDSPGADKESNWLPAPKAAFQLILRGYLPQKALLDHSWAPPAITRFER